MEHDKVARFFIGMAIVLILLAGVFCVHTLVTEEDSKPTIATGAIKMIGQIQQKTAGPDKVLSYCEAKASQAKYNYGKIIISDANNPENYCEGKASQAKYNYEIVTLVV